MFNIIVYRLVGLYYASFLKLCCYFVVINASDKAKMLKAHSIGPVMVRYLEMIGVETLAELRDVSAEELAERINDYLGKKHINSTGIKALENLIELSLQDG